MRFDLPCLDVARALLGATLRLGGVTLRLTEVEAYDGLADPASHAAMKGRRPDTAALFAAPGTLYCYLSYGVHICANLVTTAAGSGAAVLLRAGEVVEGVALARRRRWGTAEPAQPDWALARGPGNLGRALGVTLADSGQRCGPDFSVTPGAAGPVAAGPRVGVSVAWARPWRFWLDGDPTVSAYKKSPRAVEGSW
ncbi:MAG: DNA-3-methyladenine glycosylase [Propionibacteriaceae bacterium]|jgi:DNA-3-methyladenine glycosylase|nr:DNA-3-methyladenine glycosylase [Propionibacteriaceae bacterium]